MNFFFDFQMRLAQKKAPPLELFASLYCIALLSFVRAHHEIKYLNRGEGAVSDDNFLEHRYVNIKNGQSLI